MKCCFRAIRSAECRTLRHASVYQVSGLVDLAIRQRVLDDDDVRLDKVVRSKKRFKFATCIGQYPQFIQVSILLELRDRSPFGDAERPRPDMSQLLERLFQKRETDASNMAPAVCPGGFCA